MLKIVFSLLLLFVSLNADTFGSEEQVHILFFGAFAMMIFYNFSYSLITKTAAFMSYTLFHLSLFLIMLSFTGQLKSPLTNLQVENIPVGYLFLAVVMFLGFSRDFLEVKRIIPLFMKHFNSLIVINMIFVFLSAFITLTPLLQEFTILFIVAEVSAIILFSAYLALKRETPYARFYFLSFMPLFLLVILSLVGYLAHISLSEHLTYWFEAVILLESVGLSLTLIYQHKETTLRLRQNELLFKELSHRVQNNLQQVISIITLQIGSTEDKKTQEYLEETINRISAIALIHKTLQKSSTLGMVNMATFLQALTLAYEKLDTSVSYALTCANELELDVEKLAPLALILNELITNSLKHAFSDVKKARINISLQEKEGEVLFEYEDNGEGIKKEESKDSIGSKLITILAKNQLKGELVIDTKNRYYFSLKFQNNTGASL